MSKASQINGLIKALPDADKGLITDGNHTFNELYDHRIALFITLCKHLATDPNKQPWKSKLHHDGTTYDGWFIAGIRTEPGFQISYHLPMKYWNELPVKELPIAPEWDGHTPADVVERLLRM